MKATICPKIRTTKCEDPKKTNAKDCFQAYIAPCGVSAASGGAGVTSNDYYMGDTAGTITINYNMQTVPDRLDVYYLGALVATTGGPVSGAGTLTYAYTPAGNKTVTVVVTGPSGTVWDYDISCPA